MRNINFNELKRYEDKASVITRVSPCGRDAPNVPPLISRSEKRSDGIPPQGSVPPEYFHDDLYAFRET